MKCPAQLYTASTRSYDGLPELDYPLHDRDVLVTACGRIRMHRKKAVIPCPFVKPADTPLRRYMRSCPFCDKETSTAPSGACDGLTRLTAEATSCGMRLALHEPRRDKEARNRAGTRPTAQMTVPFGSGTACWHAKRPSAGSLRQSTLAFRSATNMRLGMPDAAQRREIQLVPGSEAGAEKGKTVAAGQ
jgi:hypothetical protein